MKKLDRNDERIIKAMFAKDMKLDAAIGKTSEKIQNIEEEFRKKLEEKKRELVEENDKLQLERNKLNESILTMYDTSLSELMKNIHGDDTDEPEDDGLEVVNEDEEKEEMEEMEEETDELKEFVEKEEEPEEYNEEDFINDIDENEVTSGDEAVVNTTIVEDKDNFDDNMSLWNEDDFFNN